MGKTRKFYAIISTLCIGFGLVKVNILIALNELNLLKIICETIFFIFQSGCGAFIYNILKEGLY